ncbi:LamG-like jellyroll fold domain-containing protein [Haloferula chungangensis]|uniref:LamG-like jellyroll fold domain-containing protein n=1 Tax=Haloferula chungangensis TaxID=1048331 RepID=A0ABW2L8K1_9BACT
MKTTKPLILTLATFLPVITASGQIETDLIGYWEFEDDLTETSGAHEAGLHDGEWNVEAGTFSAGPSVNFGQALDLSGGDFGVRVKNSANSETGYVGTFDADINTANAMSVSFWVNGGLGRWSPVVSKFGENDATNGHGGWQVRRQNNNAAMTYTLRNTTGTEDPLGSNTAATASGWRHVVAVWDGSGTGTRRIFIDGVEDTAFANAAGATDTSSGGPGDAVDKFLTFGMRDNGVGGLTSFLNGQIDDVAIWSRALTQSEVVLLASNPLSEIIGQADTDGDGLLDNDEINIHGTNPNEPDTDFDGVNDFEEIVNGSDALNDNDFDGDGLTNLQETSGSANPWTGSSLGTPNGDPTDWASADSDLDGIPDGEEVVVGADTFLTNPNDPDTDADGFADGTEALTTPGTDPTNDSDYPTEWLRGLYGYWQFDGDLTDSAFLGLDGVMLGDSDIEYYAEGQFGEAIDLEKVSNQRVEVSGDENYFDIVGGDITVSAWVQVEAFNDQWQAIVAKGESTWRLARRHTTNGAAFAAGTSGDAPASNDTANANSINDGGWHHLVGVAEAGVGISLYLDGYLVEFRSNAIPNPRDTVGSVLIGANPDTLRSWNGNIDDVAIWKRKLTPEEIYEVYGNGENVEYLIANDVTPGPIPDREVVIESVGFDEYGNFNLEVSGLTATKSYEMRMTELLDGTDWYTVDGPYTGETTRVFTDYDPTAYSPKAFYQIFEVVEEP